MEAEYTELPAVETIETSAPSTVVEVTKAVTTAVTWVSIAYIFFKYKSGTL